MDRAGINRLGTTALQPRDDPVNNPSSIQAVLRADVERLAAPGTRRVGTAGHQLARDYLVERMTALGLAPYRGSRFGLAYRAGGQNFENLIGSRFGLSSLSAARASNRRTCSRAWLKF
jgi:hypothetical protein